MVTQTVQITETPCPSSPPAPSSSSNMAATTSDKSYSWSRLYGRDRKRTYKSSSYGRITSSEKPSTRIADKYGSYATALADVDAENRASRKTRADSYSGGVYASLGRHTRTSRSVDRDYSLDSEISSYDDYRYAPPPGKFARAEDTGSRFRTRYNTFSVDRNYNVTKGVEERPSSRFLVKKSFSYDANASAAVLSHEEPSYLSRSRSIELSTSERPTYEYEGLDFRTMYDGVPRRSRAASVSRIDESEGSSSYKRTIRSASVARYTAPEYEIGIARPRPTYAQMYADVAGEVRKDRWLKRNTAGSDLSCYVIDPNAEFDPTDVRVRLLPSGKKSVTYERQTQSGSGNKLEADALINRIIQKTKHMEHSMDTLENFVKRNRSLFPEDTIIYQVYTFYQLSVEQLLQIRESEDAEVYGVKLKEKLVVPRGTDVNYLLRKYYGSSDVEVEYSHAQRQYVADQEIESDNSRLQDEMRQKVEQEFYDRDKRKLIGKQSYDLKQAAKHEDKRDKYSHMHSYLTPQYIRSIYSTSGLPYDEVYTTRSQRSSAWDASSQTSDPSSRSSSSRRRKGFDAMPSFTAKLRPKKCMVGMTVRFNCSISGLPMPDITWFRGNRVIEDGGRFHISNNYGLLSLEITNANKDDAGLYTVKAANLEGEVACSASLEVQEIDLGSARPEGVKKPFFVYEPQNTWAEEGNKAVFEAQATGKPMPTFRWQKDNVSLEQTERIRIFCDEIGNTKLAVKDAKPSDSGLYFCIAETKAGKAKCAATLRIVAKGQLVDDRRRSKSREPTPTRRRSLSRERTPQALQKGEPVPKGMKPWFVQTPPAEVTVREGDPLVLKCVIDGDPRPVVRWMKSVRDLQYSERMRVCIEGDHHFLEIKSTLGTDPGQYVVIAENQCGKVQCTTWVNVTPRTEEEPDDWHIRRYDLELPKSKIEAVETTELADSAPRFVKRLPLERSVSVGQDLEVKCTIRESPEVITHTEYKLRTTGEAKLTEKVITISTKKEDKVVDVNAERIKAAEQEKIEARMAVKKVEEAAKVAAPAAEPAKKKKVPTATLR